LSINIVDIEMQFFLNFAAKKAGEKAEEATEAEPMDATEAEPMDATEAEPMDATTNGATAV
jgi:hypothetical protein